MKWVIYEHSHQWIHRHVMLKRDVWNSSAATSWSNHTDERYHVTHEYLTLPLRTAIRNHFKAEWRLQLHGSVNGWTGNIASQILSIFFSPLGKIAGRALYFACFKILYLARSANLPTGLYIFFYLFLIVAWITIISWSTGPIFAIVSPNKAFWVQIVDMDLFFRYHKRRCHGNWILWKNGKLPSFVALAFRNEKGYCSVSINSVNDASISCKNFVNFGPVTPELTELICERLVRNCKNTGVFSRISPDLLLNRFGNLFTIWKRFGCWWSLWTLFSDLSRDVAW